MISVDDPTTQWLILIGIVAFSLILMVVAAFFLFEIPPRHIEEGGAKGEGMQGE
jgi:hypothetical protein